MSNLKQELEKIITNGSTEEFEKFFSNTYREKKYIDYALEFISTRFSYNLDMVEYLIDNYKNKIKYSKALEYILLDSAFNGSYRDVKYMFDNFKNEISIDTITNCIEYALQKESISIIKYIMNNMLDKIRYDYISDLLIRYKRGDFDHSHKTHKIIIILNIYKSIIENNNCLNKYSSSLILG